MKVSVVNFIPIWLPQTQTWIYTQVQQLQQLGVNAHVVCERTQNLDQFKVVNLHCLNDEPMWRQLCDKGLRLARLRSHLDFLVATGREIGVQIVHSHFGNYGWRNLGAVRELGAKHVVTFYGLDVNMLPINFPKWRRRYLQLFAQPDLLLCEGPHMARCIIALGCPEEKVKVQHLGVDIGRIQFRPRQYCKGEPLKVLVAASFREKKGIPDAIEALGRLRTVLPVELTIIGDAGKGVAGRKEKRRILESLAHNGFSGSVRLLGYQPHARLHEEAYAHHIFLSPSVTASDGDTEGGAPVSLIEMAASGMPVISTTHCDIPEVVQHGVTGLLAAEHDVEGLASHLRWYAENPGRWEAMLLAGRRHVEQEYGLRAQGEKLVAHYRELLE